MNHPTLHHKKVAIIVLNWNGLKDTLACLASLSQVDYPDYEVVVVDNGSSDDSVTTIQAAYRDTAALVACNAPVAVSGDRLHRKKTDAPATHQRPKAAEGAYATRNPAACYPGDSRWR